MKYIIDDTLVETDPHGYLLNLDDWSEDIARQIARDEGIELTDDHWQIINLLRNYYRDYGISPNVRTLIKVVAKKYGEEIGNKRHLYNLFPLGPSRQGCKIAGLPLPNDCVDWPG
jgi:tRNA 2-thiouridine synthesizing protein E